MAVTGRIAAATQTDQMYPLSDANNVHQPSNTWSLCITHKSISKTGSLVVQSFLQCPPQPKNNLIPFPLLIQYSTTMWSKYAGTHNNVHTACLHLLS